MNLHAYLHGETMGAFLLALAPLLGGLTQPIKNYFESKAKQAELTQQLELARIVAEKESIVSGNTADTEQRKNYLESVTREFRQKAITFFMIPFCISMFAPAYAKIMWANFYGIPIEFRQFFFVVYGVILGLPIAKNVFGNMVASVGRGIQRRREYKIQKEEVKKAYNDKAFFDTMIQGLFKDGMTQSQVDIVNGALKRYKGE